MTKTIPIFFTFNNDYVVPAAVAFSSLLEKAKDDIFYEMYIAHSDITEKNKMLLEKIIKKHNMSSVKFLDTKGFLIDAWKNGNFEGHNQKNQFTVDTIVRCFAASFFPDIDKIIYSDVDVVFMDDVSELIEIDLTDKYIAGVKNAFMKFDNNELSHLSEDNHLKLKDTYLAGGIWVMNLSQIRKDNLEKRMMEIISDDSIVKRWNDQDIMNIACNKKVNFLSLRYISYPYLQERINLPNFTSHYSSEELLESIEKPKILHFAGIKPWNAFPNKRKIWWDIFEQLNIQKTRIFHKKISLKHKMYYKVWKILDRKLRSHHIIQ
jgi:lipopolysaccharide biosynthesis glycosyltransferase